MSQHTLQDPRSHYIAFITFKDIPKKITQVPLFNLYFDLCGNCGNNLQFRNIIISPSSGSRPTSTSKPPQASKGSNSGKYGTLVAQDSQARVNVRDEPRLDAYNRHYGLVGDRVYVLGSTKNQGYTWYKVQFPVSGAQG